MEAVEVAEALGADEAQEEIFIFLLIIGAGIALYSSFRGRSNARDRKERVAAQALSPPSHLLQIGCSSDCARLVEVAFFSALRGRDATQARHSFAALDIRDVQDTKGDPVADCITRQSTHLPYGIKGS